MRNEKEEDAILDVADKSAEYWVIRHECDMHGDKEACEELPDASAEKEKAVGELIKVV